MFFGYVFYFSFVVMTLSMSLLVLLVHLIIQPSNFMSLLWLCSFSITNEDFICATFHLSTFYELFVQCFSFQHFCTKPKWSWAHIFHKKGLRGMYIGLAPTMLALVPNWTAYSKVSLRMIVTLIWDLVCIIDVFFFNYESFYKVSEIFCWITEDNSKLLDFAW